MGRFFNKENQIKQPRPRGSRVKCGTGEPVLGAGAGWRTPGLGRVGMNRWFRSDTEVSLGCQAVESVLNSGGKGEQRFYRRGVT